MIHGILQLIATVTTLLVYNMSVYRRIPIQKACIKYGMPLGLTDPPQHRKSPDPSCYNLPILLEMSVVRFILFHSFRHAQ